MSDKYLKGTRTISGYRLNICHFNIIKKNLAKLYLYKDEYRNPRRNVSMKNVLTQKSMYRLTKEIYTCKRV